MTGPFPTEMVYKSGELVGMAVSSSSSICCHALAEHLLIYSLLVDCGLRYALDDLSLEHYCHTRSRSIFALEANLNVLSSLLCLVGPHPFILRCPQFGFVILLTKRLSLAPTSGCTSSPFSYATLLKQLARSLTWRGSSITVYKVTEYVRFRELSGRSEAYECFCPFEGT